MDEEMPAEEADVSPKYDESSQPTSPDIQRSTSSCDKCSTMVPAEELKRVTSTYDDLKQKYLKLKKTHGNSMASMEEMLGKQRRHEMEKDVFTAELARMKADRDSAFLSADEYRKEAVRAAALKNDCDRWKTKYSQTQATVESMASQMVERQFKYQESVQISKDLLRDQSSLLDKKLESERKLKEMGNRLSAYTKYFQPIVKLLADISVDTEINKPEAVAERLERIPFDELLAHAQTPTKTEESSDDEDAYRLECILSGIAPERASRTKTRTPARREAYVSRGRSRMAPLDDAAHDALIAKKTGRTEEERADAAAAQKTSSTIHGRKVETVREREVKIKAGLLETIRRMKATDQRKKKATEMSGVKHEDVAAREFGAMEVSDSADPHTSWEEKGSSPAPFPLVPADAERREMQFTSPHSTASPRSRIRKSGRSMPPPRGRKHVESAAVVAPADAEKRVIQFTDPLPINPRVRKSPKSMHPPPRGEKAGSVPLEIVPPAKKPTAAAIRKRKIAELSSDQTDDSEIEPQANRRKSLRSQPVSRQHSH